MTTEQGAAEARSGASTARDYVIVSCRHCGVKNRLFRWAYGDPPRNSRCGDCEAPLLLGDAPLQEIDGATYQHPWDREAMQAIHRIPGVDTLLRKLVSESFERYERLFHYSSFLHCGPEQLPRVYGIFCEAAARLDISPVPDLFVSHQESMNAYTSGVRAPYVAISATLIEELRDDELMVVFAHELGHWQSDHVLYKVAARMLSNLADSFVSRVLGLGSLALKPLQMALLKWDRCSELTADRAALLAVRDPDAVIRTMMKLSGGSSHLEPQLRQDVFLKQVQEVREMQKEHLLNRLFLLMQELFRTHPMPLWRTAELLRWAEEGSYLEILSGHYQRRGEEAPEPTTQEAFSSDNTGGDADLSNDDTEDDPLGQVRDAGQELLNQVQDAIQQGGALLRQLFGNERSNDGDDARRDKE